MTLGSCAVFVTLNNVIFAFHQCTLAKKGYVAFEKVFFCVMCFHVEFSSGVSDMSLDI